MDLTYYEDMIEGSVTTYGDYEVTKDEIIAFASEFDPQPFHLDEVAAKKSMLGGLSASGWHTAAMNMRMTYDFFLKTTASMGGPGIEELKWMKPVRPGDRLSARRTVLGKRESKSRPEMGLVRLYVEVLNQAGEVVMTQQSPMMIGRRGVPQTPRMFQPPQDRDRDEPEAAPSPQSDGPPASTRYFEDLVIGQRSEIGAETFTRENMIRFAKAYDPQPFHVDEEAAAQSHFGRLAASGWYTGACWMKHAIANRTKVLAQIKARGGSVPEGGPSPGFRDLKWTHPVYVGDTIRYATTLENKRTTSRPGWGLAFSYNTGINQNGVLVFEYHSAAFWQMKP